MIDKIWLWIFTLSIWQLVLLGFAVWTAMGFVFCIGWYRFKKGIGE